jgi:hypothetical protein
MMICGVCALYLVTGIRYLQAAPAPGTEAWTAWEPGFNGAASLHWNTGPTVVTFGDFVFSPCSFSHFRKNTPCSFLFVFCPQWLMCWCFGCLGWKEGVRLRNVGVSKDQYWDRLMTHDECLDDNRVWKVFGRKNIKILFDGDFWWWFVMVIQVCFV